MSLRDIEKEGELDPADFCLVYKYPDIGQVLIEKVTREDNNLAGIKVKLLNKHANCLAVKIFTPPTEDVEESHKSRDEMFMNIGGDWAYVHAIEALQTNWGIIDPSGTHRKRLGLLP